MKYALVTGGSRGIGRAVCEKLSEMGFHIMINFQSNLVEAEKTLDLVKSNGGSGEIIQFDISSQVEVENALGGWQQNNPGQYIHVLVNNAGIRKEELIM
ncbi:MAG: SDR family NAD(P)-dependent oxidoreductase, partial [Bacteroidota bacterium]